MQRRFGTRAHNVQHVLNFGLTLSSLAALHFKFLPLKKVLWWSRRRRDPAFQRRSGHDGAASTLGQAAGAAYASSSDHCRAAGCCARRDLQGTIAQCSALSFGVLDSERESALIALAACSSTARQILCALLCTLPYPCMMLSKSCKCHVERHLSKDEHTCCTFRPHFYSCVEDDGLRIGDVLPYPPYRPECGLAQLQSA